MKKMMLLSALIIAMAMQAQPAAAHCEIPCGIYDDELRVRLVHEHAGTVLKSMNQINELSKDGDKNYNQLIRWVSNKEQHANEIQEIVTQYFMTQRIKPKDDEAGMAKYNKELSLLHQVLLHAMKAKQTTDASHPAKIDELMHEFSESYFGEHKGSHTHGMK